ncbi:hypothetical protein [Novosphingobium sp. 9U]|uniref:hypothetical protein n=1 Tax=Novosphingobium sp. 9U TaxID=2653158 RepID=UPI0012F2DCE2|nr:hypothetical protein [Novosphingobium sp. 9U]VWX46625.1 hypothetical protein NOVOSPHI9U_10165 [Novosphingobium sp. 9U]
MSDLDNLFAEADAAEAEPQTEQRPVERSSGSRNRVKTDTAGSFVYGLADTVTFGYLDEIGAGADWLLLGKDYDKALADNRQALSDIQEDHAASYISGQLTGGFLPVLGWGGRVKAAATARGLTTGLKGMVVAGGVQGALYGSGSADGDLKSRLLGAASGGALGAAGGYVLGATIIPAAKWGTVAARDMLALRYGRTPRLTSAITPARIERATEDVAEDLQAARKETAGRAVSATRENTPRAPTFNRLTGQADDVLDEGAILTTRELVGEMSVARKAIQDRVGKMTVQQAQRWAQRLENAELSGGVVDDPHYRSLLGLDATDHGLDADGAKRAATLLEEATEAVLEKAGLGAKTTKQQDNAFKAAYGAGVTEADTAAALERTQQAVTDGRIGGHQQLLAALQFTRAKDKYLPEILKGNREAREGLLDELSKAIRIHAEGTAIKAQIARGLADMRWHTGKLAMAEIRDDVLHVETQESVRKRVDASLKELGEGEFVDLISRLQNLDDLDRVQEVLLNPAEAQAVSAWRRTMNTVTSFIKSNSLTPASGLFNTIGFIGHDFFRNGAAKRWAARNMEIAGKADEALALRFELEVGRRVYMTAHKRGIRAAMDRIKWEWWSDVERIASVANGRESKAALRASASKVALVEQGYRPPDVRELSDKPRLAVTNLTAFDDKMAEVGGGSFGRLLETLYRTRAAVGNTVDALGTATAKALVGSLDDWGRSFVKTKETYALAARQAVRETMQLGLPVEEMLQLAQQRAVQLAEMPPRDLLDQVEDALATHGDLPEDLRFALGLSQQAEKEAERVLFMDGPQTAGGQTAAKGAQMLDKAVSLGTFEGLLAPYIRTPVRIFERGMVSYTPWGSKAKEVQDILAKGGMEAELEKARMELGSMVIGMGAVLAASGAITLTNGGYDNSANLRGAPPGRLNLPGGSFVEIGRLDPFALTLALGGFVGQAVKAYQDAGNAGAEHEEALSGAIQIAFLAAREGILEKTYVTGIRDLMKSVFSDQEEGLVPGYEKAVQSAFARTIPFAGTSRTLNDTFHGSAPEAIGWMDNILRSVPGGGMLLPSKVDPLGNDVDGRALGVAFGTTSDVDPVTAQLADLGIDIQALRRADPAGFKLTSEELSDLRHIRGGEALNDQGETMKEALGYLMSDPWFQKLPSKEQKQDEIVAVMRDFNAPARELLMERNPQYASDRTAMKSLSDYMAEGLSRRDAAGQAMQDVAAMGLPEPSRM